MDMFLKTLKKHWLPLALLLLLIAALTWPLVLHLTDRYPSLNPWWGGDPDTYIWHMNWLAKVLTGDLPVSAGQMVFWPHGVNPWAGYDGVLMHLVGLPINLLAHRPFLAYNLFLLSAAVLAAFASYALAWRLTRSRLGSFFAAVIFGLSPYLLIRLAYHPNLTMIGTVPLLFLAAVNFGEKPSGRRLAWLAGAVLLNALSSWYYHAGAAVFLLLAAIHYWPNLKRHKRLAWTAVPILAIVGLLPALPMLLSSTGGGTPEVYSFVRSMGTRLPNLIFPHPLTNIFGQATLGIYQASVEWFWQGPSILESTSYLGLPTMALMVLWAVRRQKALLTAGRLWALTFFTFLILAMGTTGGWGDFRFPLPFEIFRHLPLFSLLRGPNRLFVFSLLAAALMAAAAIAYLVKTRARRWLAVFLLLFSLALLAERSMLPYPMYDPTPPEFYRQVAQEKGVFAIADLPFAQPGYSHYNRYQMTHNKPIVTGEFFYPAYTDRTFDFIENNSLLAAGVCPPLKGRPTPDYRKAMLELHENDIRYVIIHHLILKNDPDCAATAKNLRQFLNGFDHIYADGDITVYRVPPPAGVSPKADLGRTD